MRKTILVRNAFSLAILAGACIASAQSAWTTVVNNSSVMPGTNATFNSYNQPSVNAFGDVVFRARSKGGNGGEPTHGIYLRDMLRRTQTVRIFDRSSAVPQPDNTGATFTEFPSFPRIDLLSPTLATRGSSKPVWNYQLADGSDTKTGTSGVYVVRNGTPLTAASQLGAVPGYSRFQVPGENVALKFDQFPGAPAITGNLLVFKGNYTDESLSKTGVYFRDFTARKGLDPIQRIADTSTLIPNRRSGSAQAFGATAPPSAAFGLAVFTAWDDEDTPTMGGIYRAPLRANPALTTIVGIGSQVPGEASGVTFKNFGENLSFDGRFLAFWGSWGTEQRDVTLPCPTDGNKDLIAYCNSLYPSGVTTMSVPKHQGIFVYDSITRRITPLAKSPTNFDDFLYWVFSGKPPGTGGSESEDGEPARWRSSAFNAVSGRLFSFQAIFKAHKDKGPVDGIYHVNGPSRPSITTILDTTMSGQTVDRSAPAGSTITALGIEREGLRVGWLAITASMLNPETSESWGGIYIKYLP